MQLSREELEQRINDIKLKLPMNEVIPEPIKNYYDAYNQRDQIMAEEVRNNEDMINSLKYQVEELTSVVNVLAHLVFNRTEQRKSPINGN